MRAVLQPQSITRLKQNMSCCGRSASTNTDVDNRLMLRVVPQMDYTFDGYNVSRNNRLVKLKCVFIGGPGVGKTTLFKKLIGTELLNADSIATLGDFAPLNLPELEVNGRQVAIALTDTNGQENFNAMTANYLNKAALVIAVFNFGTNSAVRSITFEDSFYRLLRYLDMRASRCLHSMVLVYCNKIDLASESNHEEMRKWFEEITDKIGKDHVHVIKGCSFLNDTRESFYTDVLEATKKFIVNGVNKRV